MQQQVEELEKVYQTYKDNSNTTGKGKQKFNFISEIWTTCWATALQHPARVSSAAKPIRPSSASRVLRRLPLWYVEHVPSISKSLTFNVQLDDEESSLES